MKILIVEDSKIAVMVLLKHLEEHNMRDNITVATSITETKTLLKDRTYDLIFLDVHLNDGKGTDIINELPIDQKLIFVTSDPDYAITAFEHNALDYLVKPVDKKRFEKTMQRLQKKDKEEGYIVIRADLSFHRVNTADIRYAKSMGDYISLVTTGENYIFHGTLKKFVKKLPVEQFKRCHRSYIVNTSRIDKMLVSSIEIGDVEIPINSDFKKEMSDQFSKE